MIARWSWSLFDFFSSLFFLFFFEALLLIILASIFSPVLLFTLLVGRPKSKRQNNIFDLEHRGPRGILESHDALHSAVT